MTGSVRFVLGGRVVEVRDADPTTTVLQWLRANGRPGSKEGCAEGDCGACTVVLGDLGADNLGAGGRLRYRSVNACILFLPMIDGKLLLTVEDLAAEDGELHPVQTAMVTSHASQCGFCTPGFVMALFALYHTERAPKDDAIHDALAGNLCRCTGYRPILDAARAATADRAEDRFDRAEEGIAALLESIRRDTRLEVSGGGNGFHAPRTVDELARLVAAHPHATLVAGATDVGLWVTKQGRRLATLIHLAEVAELHRIEEHPDRLEVGAAATYTELLPVLCRRLPELADLVGRIGAAQVRNSGTLGGNVANGSPIGDSMPALLALGATLVLNHGGTRRELPLDRFYHGYRKSDLKPGEFVERIRIPLPKPGQRFATWKVSKRRDQDISAVCAAFLLTLDEGGRVADLRTGYGGVAATPARAAALETALAGQPWTADAVAAALPALDRDFQPITDMRASDRYRALVAKNLLVRFHLSTTGAKAPSLEAAHG
ncbi:xanthine dehydrogenase small subunit [Azospirillum rugosum]|uniref:Xanthine dehydrogenase small subunit n=1 Tax=Azospirillum rugosum TaxID=416170 RepID=A0ABS4SVV5_9PROT|nr:xanthine dehydrogenase small subunit [Azospirillum rugosum]MBP2296700.1 xanthine dehydrogenase small subunit [Azospirillum rugosum]MDQ0530487.1 xanthine dehydrogenase small subunit [Azospirillum rugosum]